MTQCSADPEVTPALAEVSAEHLRRPAFADEVVRLGWIDRESLEMAIAELRAWGRRGDAYSASLHCAAIGWVG